MTIALVGTGSMAHEYYKVLKELSDDIVVIGNSPASVRAFEIKTNAEAYSGGFVNVVKSSDFDPSRITHAIVAVGAESLFQVTRDIIKTGIKNILVEKPACLYEHQLGELVGYQSSDDGLGIYVGYNRRFYQSVMQLEECLLADGGLLSFTFDFTEWSHIVEREVQSDIIKNNWFIANSTHVVDLAFFIGGEIKDLSSYTSGSLSWHDKAIYSGAGITKENILFSYHSNWSSAGRWSLEFNSPARKYILRPLESLQAIDRGTVKKYEISTKAEYDKRFKPGLYLQVEAFLNGNVQRLCNLDQHLRMFRIYKKISADPSI